ncbi:DoxX family protein [Steroidobacter sp. S1-65]|uniref:DoxX family protein n=1 Tax=Steroidobacter gossypii TaxID=2805490 RepID=A0ABS1X049_9GAMM|nr:DoxX family protein [Steroidobacter gossypii]MBM0106620.1 DoxX family protein [Steroidobacter gossypii]
MLDTKQARASQRPLLVAALDRFYARSGTLAYVLLRVAFGLTIVTHGIPKLTGRAHGSMADPLQGSTHLIANVLHLPFAPELAMFVALLETFGGLAVAIGLATRLFASLLAIQMVFICIALGPTYPWIDRGIEYPIMLGFVALLIATHGAVACAIDHRIGRKL